MSNSNAKQKQDELVLSFIKTIKTSSPLLSADVTDNRVPTGTETYRVRIELTFDSSASHDHKLAVLNKYKEWAAIHLPGLTLEEIYDKGFQVNIKQRLPSKLVKRLSGEFVAKGY